MPMLSGLAPSATPKGAKLVLSDPNLGVSEGLSRVLSGQIGDDPERGLKERMRRAVETLGPDWTLRRVAEATGENYKNVLRWISGETTLPAEFLVRFLAQVPVDHQYVLFGVDRSV